MAQIITLCELCVKDLRDSFSLKAYPGIPITEKKKNCERCRRKYRDEILKQYMIQRRDKR